MRGPSVPRMNPLPPPSPDRRKRSNPTGTPHKGGPKKRAPPIAATPPSRAALAPPLARGVSSEQLLMRHSSHTDTR